MKEDLIIRVITDRKVTMNADRIGLMGTTVLLMGIITVLLTGSVRAVRVLTTTTGKGDMAIVPRMETTVAVVMVVAVPRMETIVPRMEGVTLTIVRARTTRDRVRPIRQALQARALPARA